MSFCSLSDMLGVWGIFLRGFSFKGSNFDNNCKYEVPSTCCGSAGLCCKDFGRLKLPSASSYIVVVWMGSYRQQIGLRWVESPFRCFSLLQIHRDYTCELGASVEHLI